MIDLRSTKPRIRRSGPAVQAVARLPSTADQSRGSSNLATRARAGNVSSDTRAGRPG